MPGHQDTRSPAHTLGEHLQCALWAPGSLGWSSLAEVWSQDGAARGRWVGGSGEGDPGDHCRAWGSHVHRTAQGTRHLPHCSRTRISHNPQCLGRSSQEKSYTSKFHASSKTWTWVLGCTGQDPSDPGPRALQTEMNEAHPYCFLLSSTFSEPWPTLATPF